MNTNKKTPKLRFKGFTDDWEQRKLSDISTKVTTKNIDVHYTETLTNSAEQGIISQVDFFDKEISNKDNINGYYIVENNDFIYNPRISTLAPVGPINRNKLNRTGIMSPLYTVFRASNVDLDFLEWYFQSSHWHRYMKLNGDSGARADRIAIKDSTFFDMPIKTPVNIKEQVLIGETLEKFNQYITLHQRKLEKLKLNKSALLQKLFPQKGCTIPDVRFKGFTDAWEQRKLNDFGIATGGTSIESEFVDGGTYKVINIGSYSEESVYNDQGLRVNKTDKTKSRILNKYDLTMILNDKTASGNIIGRVLLIDQDNTYVYNQRTERIEVDTKNFLPMFLYHMLNAPEQRKYIVKASQGNTQIYVNWSTISNIDYMIPQLLLEQEKIANLFSLINKDITLHQRKLDCLISIKKGLLQQLFV